MSEKIISTCQSNFCKSVHKKVNSVAKEEKIKDRRENQKETENDFFPQVIFVTVNKSTAITGLWISFSIHSPNWRVVSIFTRQVKKQLAKNIERVSERGKNNSPDWQVGLYFYSPILNSTHIWRVVIHTPAVEP
jgi:hypothetical protein